MKLSLVILRTLLVLLVLHYSISIQGQHLTISTGGQTGTSGTNWGITGNILNVSASGSANIHPSVITDHLTNTGSLTITLPGQAGTTRDVYINNTIQYTGSNARTLTINAANNLIVASGVSITSSTAVMNLVLRSIFSSGSPDHGRMLLHGITINTNGGHFWAGGGSGDITWNGLTVGNGVARTWTDDVPGLWIENSTLNTNGGNVYLAGLSWNSSASTGVNYGVHMVNSVISSVTGNIEINGEVKGRYAIGNGTRIESTTTATSITTTTGSIIIRGTGSDQATNNNGNRFGAVITGSSATAKTTISSTSGSIHIEGNANFTATVNDKEGLGIGGSTEIISRSGNITLRGTNSLESSGQYCNSIRFHSSNASNSIRVGFDGTNSYTGNILIEGNSIYQRSTHSSGAGSIAIQTTGTLTIQPTGAAFTYMRAGDAGTLTYDDDWDFGTSLSGFTLGKTTNNSNVTFANNLTTSGPITAYGGSITLNSNVKLEATGGDILLDADLGSALSQSFHGIYLNAGATLKTNTSGDITLLGRSGTGATCQNSVSCRGIYANAGATITSAEDIDLSGLSFTTGNSGRGIDIFGVTLTAGANVKLTGQHSANASFAVALSSNGATHSTITAGNGITLEALNNNTGTVFMANGTTLNGGSGDIEIIAAIIDPSTATKDITTTGHIRLLPDADQTSFGAALNTQYLNFINATGLTIGKEGNTANLTIGRVHSIAGPIDVYGGNIGINQNLNTSGGAENGDVLLKASGDIILESGKSITTTGGDVILWANSDGGTSNGGVFLDAASSITTTGGHVWIGGSSTNGGSTTWNGITVGNGYATSGRDLTTFQNEGTAIDWDAGVLLDETTINTGGGNIYIAGRRSVSPNSRGGAGVINYSGTNGTLINAGTGTITILGETSMDVAGSDLGIMTGLHPNNYTGRLTIQSANTSSTTAISITASTVTADAGLLVEDHTRILSTATSGGGGISMTVSSGTGSALQVGIGSNSGTLDLLSASGAIAVDGGSDAITVPVTVGTFRIGSISGDADVPSSNANVTLTSNTMSLAGSVPIITTGTLTIAPTTGSSFTSTFSTAVLNYTGITGLNIGHSSNTANITISSAQAIAGPITIYGGNIAINQNISTTNNGNIVLNAETGSQLSFTGSGISLASNKSITTSGTGSISLSGRGGNSNAGSQFGIVLGAGSSITTSGSGNITLNGIGGNGGASKNYGVSFASGTNINISTEGGNIAITGVGNGVVGSSDNDGVNIQTATINAKAGTITIDGGVDHTGSNSESITYENAIAIGGVGQTGNIILRGNDMWSRNTGAKSIQTTGTLTIEPSGNSFSSALSFPFDNFSLNSITGLTIGKTSNTANIIFGSATSIAGPINVYGGDLTINENISSTANSAGMLFKASGNIRVTGEKSITTQGGNVILWANSDGQSSDGFIALQSNFATSNGTKIQTNGGHIWIGGGSGTATWKGITVGNGYAVSGTGIAFLNSTNSGSLPAGILMQGAKLLSGGGDVRIAGSSSSASSRAVVTVGNVEINAANGKIEIQAIASSLGGAFGTGWNHNSPNEASMNGNFRIVSNNSSADAIILNADATLSNVTNGDFQDEGSGLAGLVSLITTNGGGITYNSLGSSTRALAYGLRLGYSTSQGGTLEMLSNAGNITLNTGNRRIFLANNLTNTTLGFKASTVITASTSELKLITNDLSASGALNFNTNGIVIIEPSGSSFTSSVNTSELLYNSGVTGLTIGKVGNNSTITIGSGTSISGPITIYGGIINVNGNVSATNNITFSGSSLVLNTPITLLSNDVILGSNTTLTANSTNYFKTTGTGKVKRSVANGSSFSYPVGNSSYNPITITNNTGAADDFSVRVADEVLEGGTTGTAITDKVVKRTWHVGKTNANSGSGVDMTFQWAASEEGTNMTDYKLSHYGNAWALAAGASGAVSGTTTKTMTHTGYTGTFSPFAIGGSTSVLPVTWLSFTGKKVTQGVELNWSTSSEQNTKEFQVQHSINAQQWTSVGNMPAAGNSNTVRNYRFVHEGPFKNSIQHYYRILQRDLDGKFSYSKVIRIEYPEAATDVVLYPNPASDVLHINITERQELRLVNMQGVVVWKGVLPAGRHEIPVSNFATGNYILQAGKGVYKVMVQ